MFLFRLYIRNNYTSVLVFIPFIVLLYLLGPIVAPMSFYCVVVHEYLE